MHIGQKELASLASRYQHLWREVDAVRAVRNRKTPRDVFLSDAEAVEVLRTAHAIAKPEGEDWHRLLALSAWRPTQDVYTIDPSILSALVDTSVETLPTAALLLPAWCVYVETPAFSLPGLKMDGFFVSCGQRDDGQKEIRFYPMMSGYDRQPFTPFSYGISDKLPPVDAWMEALDASMRIRGVGRVDKVEIRKKPEFAAMSTVLQALTSITLYVCAETVGQSLHPWDSSAGNEEHGEHGPRIAKKGWRIYPPDKPHRILLGGEIGEKIRASIAERTTRQSDIPRSGPRPHIRRAHWHGYWSGPKTGERVLRARWMPPIAVALRDEDGE